MALDDTVQRGDLGVVGSVWDCEAGETLRSFRKLGRDDAREAAEHVYHGRGGDVATPESLQMFK